MDVHCGWNGLKAGTVHRPLRAAGGGTGEEWVGGGEGAPTAQSRGRWHGDRRFWLVSPAGESGWRTQGLGSLGLGVGGTGSVHGECGGVGRVGGIEREVGQVDGCGALERVGAGQCDGIWAWGNDGIGVGEHDGIGAGVDGAGVGGEAGAEGFEEGFLAGPELEEVLRLCGGRECGVGCEFVRVHEDAGGVEGCVGGVDVGQVDAEAAVRGEREGGDVAGACGREVDVFEVMGGGDGGAA